MAGRCGCYRSYCRNLSSLAIAIANVNGVSNKPNRNTDRHVLVTFPMLSQTIVTKLFISYFVPPES